MDQTKPTILGSRHVRRCSQRSTTDPKQVQVRVFSRGSSAGSMQSQQHQQKEKQIQDRRHHLLQKQANEDTPSHISKQQQQCAQYGDTSGSQRKKFEEQVSQESRHRKGRPKPLDLKPDTSSQFHMLYDVTQLMSPITNHIEKSMTLPGSTSLKQFQRSSSMNTARKQLPALSRDVSFDKLEISEKLETKQPQEQNKHRDYPNSQQFSTQDHLSSGITSLMVVSITGSVKISPRMRRSPHVKKSDTNFPYDKTATNKTSNAGPVMLPPLSLPEGLSQIQGRRASASVGLQPPSYWDQWVTEIVPRLYVGGVAAINNANLLCRRRIHYIIDLDGRPRDLIARSRLSDCPCLCENHPIGKNLRSHHRVTMRITAAGGMPKNPPALAASVPGGSSSQATDSDSFISEDDLEYEVNLLCAYFSQTSKFISDSLAATKPETQPESGPQKQGARPLAERSGSLFGINDHNLPGLHGDNDSSQIRYPDGPGVLVASYDGDNRAPAIVAAYLMKVGNGPKNMHMTLRNAVKYLKSRMRSEEINISAGLMAALGQWEKRICGEMGLGQATVIEPEPITTHAAKTNT